MQTPDRLIRMASPWWRPRRRAGSEPQAALEVLEPRLMLSATLVTPLADTTIDTDAPTVSTDLFGSFDDPDIAGTVTSWTSNLGSVFVELFDAITHVSVANFLRYVDAQRYNSPGEGDTFIHRLSPNFVVQGGGFRWDGANDNTIEQFAPVPNEFDKLRDALGPGAPINARGTIAYAKLGGPPSTFSPQYAGPNSATNQWFFNLNDNSGNLDNQNGGFTTFARVLFGGMVVIDAIAALSTFLSPSPLISGSTFDEIPLQNFVEGNPVETDNIIRFTDISRAQELSFQVTNNTAPGVVTAAIDGRSLVLTPMAGQSGPATITVEATDLQGNTVDDIFTVTIADGGNRNPVVDNAVVDPTVDEDAGDTLIDLSTVFSDPDGDGLTFSVTANSNPRTASTQLVGADLTIDYQAEQNGPVDLTARATDPSGAFVEDTFTITVMPMNDDPVLVLPVGPVSFSEDVGLLNLSGLAVFNDVDIFTDFDPLTFSVIANDNLDLATTSVAGNTVTFDIQDNQSGEVTFTMRATDAADVFAEDTFTISISATNDPPTVADPIVQVDAIEDDDPLMISLLNVFEDVDLNIEGDELTFTVESNDNADLVGATIVNDDLVLALTPEGSGMATITVRATDLATTIAEDTFTVEVAEVNDPVVAVDDEELTSIGQEVIIAVVENDRDIDGQIDPTTVAVIDPPDDGDFSIDPVTGDITYSPDAGLEGPDMFTYTVRNTDGDLSNEATVTVTVLPGVPIGTAEASNRVIFEVAAITVTVKVRGDGEAEVLDVGADRISIDATGVTDKTTVTVTTKGGLIDLVNFTADGSMKSLVAKTTNLLGNIDVAGTIGSIAMNNVADEHEVIIGPSEDPRDTVSLTFNLVNDLSIISQTPIKALTVTEWTDTDEQTDRITAPSLGKLSSKGNRRNEIPGDFHAHLDLDGSDNAKQTLGSAKIAGSATGDWTLTGDVGSLTFGGAVDNFNLLITSNLKSFKAGRVTDTTIDVEDHIGTVQMIDFNGGSVTAATAKSIATKGDKRNGVTGDLNDVVVTLSGSSDVRTILGKLSAAGGSSSSTIDVTGDTGTIDIKGAVDGLDLTVQSAAKTIKLGDTNEANITVDEAGTIQTIRWLAGQLVATVVKTIKTLGNRKTLTPGDFGPDVTVLGDPEAKKAVSSTSIKGTALASTWRVNGPSGAFKADIIADGFDAAFNGTLKSVSSLGASGGSFAALSIGGVSIKTEMTGGTFTGGIDFGADEIFGNEDDLLLGGDDAFIKKITVGGNTPGGVLFIAGLFPRSASLNKQKIDPLTDGRFQLT